MYVVVVKKFAFAISSPDEFLVIIITNITIMSMIRVSYNPRTTRTLYNKKDVFGVKRDTEKEQSKAELSDTVRAKTPREEL